MRLHGILICICFFVTFLSHAQQHHLMPVPSGIIWGAQQLRLDSGFQIVMNDTAASRAGKAVTRFLRRLDDRCHLFIKKEFLKSSGKQGPGLLIEYSRIGMLKPGEDESYALTVTGDHAHLTATTDLGVLHGLETFLQLVENDNNGFYIPGVSISDHPRFTWRGLMIDVCRHFSPIEIILRNIDAMAMVKLNVLHLHLSEDQGFRIESKMFPNLHRMGSNGDYFTQEQIKTIFSYAGDRGIRVVPEFDMPGHATSWFAGHPELASAPGPYAIEKKFGVFDPTMDPTKKKTYKFLKKFLSEMCKLFPDEYFHIGGDENNGKQWDANPEIQKFMHKEELRSNHELQNYFNRKVLAMLQHNGKKMIGWDEILQPDLPVDAVIQSWRGKEGLKDATSKGFQVILSNGYYIDLVEPAWKHYNNDPLPVGTELTESQQKLVLGGEATMWAELVTPENIESRIWPRTAAIAERLWSPREINNIPDMYRRLADVSIRLEETGVQHLRNQDMMLRRLSNNTNVESLKVLVSLVEPLEEYKRHKQGVPYSTDLPFTRLPDIAFPESDIARDFKILCEKFVKGRDTTIEISIRNYLTLWMQNHDAVLATATGNPALSEWIRLSQMVKTISVIGLESLDKMKNHNAISTEWTSLTNTTLTEAALPFQECELMITEPIKMLFQNALPR